MFWILDVFIIAVLIGSICYGYFKGFLRIASGVVCFFLQIALTIAGIGGFLLLFHLFGAVDSFSIALLDLIGETSGFFKLFNIESISVCYYLALIILAFVSFVFSYAIVILLFKLLGNLFKNVGRKGKFRVVDGIVGLVINLLATLAIIFLVFGVFHAFKSTNVLTGVREVIRACPVSNILYSINPFNALIDSFKLPQLFV